MAIENISPTGTAALEYAARGWAVVPLHYPIDGGCSCKKADCSSVAKHPRTKNGLKDSTTDEATIRQWWKRWPEANVGVLTGSASGMFVLDVDPRNGGDLTLARLEQEHGPLPATLTAKTGGGGQHILFEHPGLRVSAGVKLGPGLDIKGEGGYIVAAPSLHASGGRYEWDQAPLPAHPSSTPDWILAAIAAKVPAPKPRGPVEVPAWDGDARARQYGLGLLNSLAQELGDSKSNRNDGLNWAAYRVGRLSIACGITEDMAYHILMDACVRNGLIKDDGQRKTDSTFRSGWKSGLAEPTEPPPRTDREVPAPSNQRNPMPQVESHDAAPAAAQDAQAEAEADLNGDARQAPPSDWRATALARFGLDLARSRFRIGAWGVGESRKGDDGEERIKAILPRPIWPAALGTDVTSGAEMIKLAWYGTDGRERSQWVRAGIAGDRNGLYALADRGAPVTIKNAPSVADWLCEASGCVVPARRGALVASAIGWAVVPGQGRVFVWPGSDGIEFIGEPLPCTGTPEAWAEGLQLLVELGEEGYMGLAALGLAAAAPLVRPVGRRRPILGVAFKTSQGKTSILNLALSVWASPEALTIQAMNSTPKGVEEAAIRVPDLPVLLDDFQEPATADPQRAGHSLYFLSNGQQRTTARKDGGVSGGKPRFGVAFYAAEYSIAGAMQGGADRRVVELTGRPLPEGREDLSNRLKAIASQNGGAIAGRVLEAIGPRVDELTARAERDARDLREECPDLKGDDALTASLVGIGLDVLSQATGLVLPAGEVAAWFAVEGAAVRDERPDQTEEAFIVLVRIVDSAEWTNGRAMQGGFELAFSTDTNEGPALDVNPTHEAIRRALEPFGGEKKHRAAWADRGLIAREGKDLLVQKKRNGEKLRVLRILREVCERFGMRAVPTGYRQVGTARDGVGTAESMVQRGF
jgi:hypothetical protein